MAVVIDIETRSTHSLQKVGVNVYAADPTTSITHVGYKPDDDAIRVWQPARGPIPIDLHTALADPNKVLIAHNAGFERAVMSGSPGRAIGLPSSALSGLNRWNCTAARCGQVGLPRDLAAACRALNLAMQKDLKGRGVMLQCCRPRTLNPLTWWDDVERMDQVGDYCFNDVRAEALLDKSLPQLTESERAIELATERLNNTGVLIDQTLLHRLIDLAAAARLALDKQIRTLTNGMVPRVSNAMALGRWLREQGLEIEGTAKDTVLDLLETDDLDELIRDVLQIRQVGGGSSSLKAAAIGRQLCADRRIRGALIYCGAAATGRWSSHGPQMQNLPRTNPAFHPRHIIRDIAADATLQELEDLHGPVLKLVSELLRPLLVAPPGKVLVTADYSQIEARVLAWLAGQHDRLDVFRAFNAGRGPDAYRVTAARLYDVTPAEITPEQRQIGKVGDLALGYGGGWRAFRSMAKNFNVKKTTAEAEAIKYAWRAAHPAIEQFWRDLNAAATECIAQQPGEVFTVGRVAFQRTARVMKLRLPSGRRLTYWNPSLQYDEKWGNQVHCFGQDALTRQWIEFKAYGGLFAENVTQATSRDLLADALVRLDAAELNPVLTVHDEAICETDAANVGAVTEIMMQAPAWASGLPIAVDVNAGPRYLKGK